MKTEARIEFEKASKQVSRQIGCITSALHALKNIQRIMKEEFGIDVTDPDGNFKKAEDALDVIVGTTEATLAGVEDLLENGGFV